MLAGGYYFVGVNWSDQSQTGHTWIAFGVKDADNLVQPWLSQTSFAISAQPIGLNDYKSDPHKLWGRKIIDHKRDICPKHIFKI